MRIIGIRRDAAYSPNMSDADTAIFEAVATRLEVLGHEVTRLSDADFLNAFPDDNLTFDPAMERCVEEAERIFRQSEAIQSQGERGGFGVESGGGYLEIAHNPSHFGGYGRESGDAITINLSPVYNIEAGVDPDALMPALRQNDKELRDLIIRTMKDYEYNKRRRALI